jgi:bacillithiol synthase
VRLADEATRQGIASVPVFWLATEDHDLAEVNHATFFDGLELKTLATTAHAAADAPISSVPLGSDITDLVRQASFIVGGEAAEMLSDAYQPGRTLGDAFARLYARLFADYGVILLDSSDPELHEIARPVYRKAIEDATGLSDALLARGRELVGVGYHEQVKVTASSTLLFAMQDGARTSIQRSNGRFSIGREQLSEVQLLARLESRPQEFSAKVLLRPIVQDYLLPTLAYFGGPAEIA